MMELSNLLKLLNGWAPPHLAENYDNVGLLVAAGPKRVTSALTTLDVTEAVIAEAKALKCKTIIAHHPIIFNGLKSLKGNHFSERMTMAAIKAEMNIICVHTNLDNVIHGVNGMIADKLGLAKEGRSCLVPKEGDLNKLVVFVPETSADEVRMGLFEAGAGKIGNYDGASFNLEGIGTFRGNQESNPRIGKVGQMEEVKELRMEFLVAKEKMTAVLGRLHRFDYYEEKAFDIIPLVNANPQRGSGLVGHFPKAMGKSAFLGLLEKKFKAKGIRYSQTGPSKIQKVALCGGSGSFLTQMASRAGADALVTADFKYHDWFEVPENMLVTDIGHYESERFTPHLIAQFLKGKIRNFAVHISKINTNPIKYF